MKHASSTSINSDFEYVPEWIDPEPRACEGSNAWKRIGEDKWVIMYDCYTLNPNKMGFCKTTNFISPKRGAVVAFTPAEARRRADHWKLDNF